jgi:hypothetical protein
VQQGPSLPTRANPDHVRVRGGENNAYFALANVCDAVNDDRGLGDVFGPDAVSRRAAK